MAIGSIIIGVVAAPLMMRRRRSALGQALDGMNAATGGQVRGADGSLVGSAATAMLVAMAVDIAVIGCSGFAPDGAPTDFDPQKVAVKQAALAHARKAVLVADAAKFGRHAVLRIGPPARFAALVTDGAPPPAGLAAGGSWEAVGTLARKEAASADAFTLTFALPTSAGAPPVLAGQHVLVQVADGTDVSTAADGA